MVRVGIALVCDFNSYFELLVLEQWNLVNSRRIETAWYLPPFEIQFNKGWNPTACSFRVQKLDSAPWNCSFAGQNNKGLCVSNNTVYYE